MDFDAPLETGYGVGLAAGWQLSSTAAAGAQLCPFVSIAGVFGPNLSGAGLNVESRTVSAAGGASFGIPLPLVEGRSLVPFASLALARARRSFSVGDAAVNSSDTFAQLGLGIGLVISNRLTVRPAVSIPVGREDGQSTLSIAAYVNLGRRR